MALSVFSVEGYGSSGSSAPLSVGPKTNVPVGIGSRSEGVPGASPESAVPVGSGSQMTETVSERIVPVGTYCPWRMTPEAVRARSMP